MEDPAVYFVIDGRDYEVPDLDTVTMGEAIIVYEYSGLALDELAGNSKHPGVIAALMHIAYQRGNPGEPKVGVRQLIEQTSLVSALEKMGGEDGPPEVGKTEQMPSSLPSSSSSDASSGPGSENASGDPADVLKVIGATR
jgi:hypothetical protein